MLRCMRNIKSIETDDMTYQFRTISHALHYPCVSIKPTQRRPFVPVCLHDALVQPVAHTMINLVLAIVDFLDERFHEFSVAFDLLVTAQDTISRGVVHSSRNDIEVHRGRDRTTSVRQFRWQRFLIYQLLFLLVTLQSVIAIFDQDLEKCSLFL